MRIRLAIPTVQGLIDARVGKLEEKAAENFRVLDDLLAVHEADIVRQKGQDATNEMGSLNVAARYMAMLQGAVQLAREAGEDTMTVDTQDIVYLDVEAPDLAVRWSDGGSLAERMNEKVRALNTHLENLKAHQAAESQKTAPALFQGFPGLQG
jgi:hypothetical protein